MRRVLRHVRRRAAVLAAEREALQKPEQDQDHRRGDADPRVAGQDTDSRCRTRGRDWRARAFPSSPPRPGAGTPGTARVRPPHPQLLERLLAGSASAKNSLSRLSSRSSGIRGARPATRTSRLARSGELVLLSLAAACRRALPFDEPPLRGGAAW